MSEVFAVGDIVIDSKYPGNQGTITDVHIGPEPMVTINWHDGTHGVVNVYILKHYKEKTGKVKPKFQVGDRVYFIEHNSILSRKYPLGVISRMSFDNEDRQLCTIQWDNGVVATHQEFEIESVEKAFAMLSQPIPKD